MIDHMCVAGVMETPPHADSETDSDGDGGCQPKLGGEGEHRILQERDTSRYSSFRETTRSGRSYLHARRDRSRGGPPV